MTENTPDGAEPEPDPTQASGYPPPPPPAPGAYPPAPSSGYPPPVAAQPGYPPPGATQPGYAPPGQPAANSYQSPNQVQVGDAFSYGWNAFTQNAAAILIATLIYVAAFAAVGIALFAILIGTSTTTVTTSYGYSYESSGAAFGFATILFGLIMVLLSFFLQAGIINGTLAVTRGKKLEVADFFRFPNFGSLILTALLVGLGVAILSITFIGGIIFAFFAQFALYFVVDKGLSPIDAVKASFNLVYANLTVVILLFVGVYIAEAIGAMLCGIGLLVTMPVALIATAFVYRRLNGELPH